MQSQSNIEGQKGQQINHFGIFRIFLLSKTAQNAYGMKNADYQRYRRYCSHKIFKLRHSLGVKLGNKTKFIKKDIIKQKPHDSKILQVLLFNAEKNWAHANQTKFSQVRKPSQKSRAKFFSVKRLKKALDWAKKLRIITLQKSQDGLTKLQAQAYQLFLEGTLQFQKQNWVNAQSKFIACRQIMSDISKSSDFLSQKVIKQKIDQIEQSIKFCNFKISKGKELTITEIVELRKGGDASLSNLIDSLAQKRLNDINLTDEKGQIYFGVERYPIKEQLIIKQKVKIDNSHKNLHQIQKKWTSNMQDEKLYEELLYFYSSLVLQVDQAIKLCNSQRQDSKKKQKYTQGQLQILKKVAYLFQEMKMKIFIDRNLTVFKYSNQMNRGRKSSPQTIAKLLTATISLFQQLGEIIKQKGKISNTFDIEDIQVLDGKSFYLRTLRLEYVGQVYYNNGKLKQAYGLWTQCQRCIKILISKEEMNQNNDEQKFIGSLVGLSTIRQHIKAHKLKCIIQNYSNQENKKDQMNKKINQIHIREQTDDKTRLNTTSLEKLIEGNQEGDNRLTLEEISQVPIIQLPGRLQLLPTRPIFFNLYYNEMLYYPQLQNKLKQASTTKSTSWWGRFFK